MGDIYYGCKYYRHGCELGGPCDGCMRDVDEDEDDAISKSSFQKYTDRVRNTPKRTSNYIKFEDLMSNNPMDQLVEVAQEAVNHQNCETSMAVCMALIQLFECKEKKIVSSSCNCNNTLLTVSIKKGDNSNILRISAAGLTKDRFKVNIDNIGNLVVAINDSDEEISKQKGELSIGQFNYKQVFALPWGLKKEDIKASFQDNALCISIPITSTLENKDSLFDVEIE